MNPGLFQALSPAGKDFRPSRSAVGCISPCRIAFQFVERCRIRQIQRSAKQCGAELVGSRIARNGQVVLLHVRGQPEHQLHLLCGSCPSVQDFVSGFLPTPPHSDAVAINSELNHLHLQRTHTSKRMPMLGVQQKWGPVNTDPHLNISGAKGRTIEPRHG